MGATVSIGSSLTPLRPLQARRFIMEKLAYNSKRIPHGASGNKFFTMAGVPTASTAIESPGSNNCWIWDSTNSDLYFVYNWSDSTTYDVVKIVD